MRVAVPSVQMTRALWMGRVCSHREASRPWMYDAVASMSAHGHGRLLVPGPLPSATHQ